MFGLLKTLFSSSRDGYRDPHQLKGAIDDPRTRIHLVDVRTREEYTSGHIPGARNVPYDRIGATPPTRNTEDPIVVYCRTGSRSGAAERTLKSMGYKNVTNFGGIGDWPFDVER